MLGKTAGGMFWIFRYLERSENTARMLDAGFRIAMTRSEAAGNEWASLISTNGSKDVFLQKYKKYESSAVIDFLLCDRDNPSSVISVINAARNNARMVRSSLSREVWEAINTCWITLKNVLNRRIEEQELPAVITTICQQSTMIRGTFFGTMIRNDIFSFSRLGTCIERADNMARMLDVKYYVLLPSVSLIGSTLDNIQWETILRAISAPHVHKWLNEDYINPKLIAEFLILERRMPRSLICCYEEILDNLNLIANSESDSFPSIDQAEEIMNNFENSSIDTVFEFGLHEFIIDFIHDNNALSEQIQKDFRFYR